MVGWYHSHPGYGCWLSGIDCSTQMMQQQYQDPFLAIVVDPHRTIASGKIEIGAFRTYPEVWVPHREHMYQLLWQSACTILTQHALLRPARLLAQGPAATCEYRADCLEHASARVGWQQCSASDAMEAWVAMAGLHAAGGEGVRVSDHPDVQD